MRSSQTILLLFLCYIQRIHEICQQEINSDDQHKPNVILKNIISLTTTDFNFQNDSLFLDSFF